MSGDRKLVQIVDAGLAEAERKAGDWLVCRPGCTGCCMGPFPITQADGERLRGGLAELASRDRLRAERVIERARQSVRRLEASYPGDTLSRVLEEDEAGEAEPCPALGPETGTCELYEARPLICRMFGPPLRFAGEPAGVCELCFEGASDAEIVACEVELQVEDGVDGEHSEATAVAWELMKAAG